MKYTRQGVRDLNSIGPRKSVGVKLPMPPLQFMCDHRGKLVEDPYGCIATCSVCVVIQLTRIGNSSIRRELQGKTMKFADIPQFVPEASYMVHISLDYLPRSVARYVTEYGLDLSPDFQRGYVWTIDQKTRFVEWVSVYN